MRLTQEVKKATDITMPVSLHAPDSEVADDFDTALEGIIDPSTDPTN